MGQILGLVLGDQIQPLFVEPTPTDLDCWLYEWFTLAERLKLNQLPASRRTNRIIGYTAAKRSLTTLLGISPHEITIEHYASGVPYAFVKGDNYPISLSHVCGYGAALISLHSYCYLGIDIAYDRGHSVADLIRRVSTPMEKIWLFSGNSRRRFFELWALKEAALKVWGVGMRIAPWEVEVACPVQISGITTIRCLSTKLPQLCGTIMPDTVPYAIGISWLDGAANNQSILQAYQQPRGLHLGC